MGNFLTPLGIRPFDILPGLKAGFFPTSRYPELKMQNILLISCRTSLS
ncbi:hypothetical protein OKW34_003617 [Paraburkholderia youngii]